MATVAAVYNINPFLSTATQIVNPQEYELRSRPKLDDKRVWASWKKMRR